MKIKSLLFFPCCVLVVSLLWGCGGSGPGSPGGQGSGDTGVILNAFLTPTYLGGNTKSVDVFRQLDCDGDPETIDPEPFTDHGATVTLNARLINPNPQIPPGTLFIEKYTIEYRRSQDSIGSPPIETDVRFSTIVIEPPPVGSGIAVTEASLVLVDLVRKDRYLTDVLSGQFASGTALINNYTATYTFEGKNQYGERFVLIAQADFQIGDFDYCE